MSDTGTPLRDVHSIHTPIDPLAALPARQYTLSTLYLTAPLDCTTPAHRTRQYWPTPAPLISGTHHTGPHCTSPVVPGVTRYVHVLPP